LAKQFDEVVVFVEQQGLRLFPLILHAIENQIYVMVYTPSYVVVPIRFKVGCAPILNLLRLDSK
jgi:hypothetical protein